jgi:hypothetical protein
MSTRRRKPDGTGKQPTAYAPGGKERTLPPPFFAGELVLSILVRPEPVPASVKELCSCDGLSCIFKSPHAVLTGGKCKYKEKTFFPEILHCPIENGIQMCIIWIAGYAMQEFLHYSDPNGQEETKMLWIMMIAVVALGAMAVREQNHAEDEAATMIQLSREFMA